MHTNLAKTDDNLAKLCEAACAHARVGKFRAAELALDDAREIAMAIGLTYRLKYPTMVIAHCDHGPHPIDADLYASLIREARATSLDVDTLSCAQDLCITVEPASPTDHQPRIFEAFFLGHMVR